MLHHRCVLQFFHEQRQICGVCEEEFVPDFLSSSSVRVAGVFFFFCCFFFFCRLDGGSFDVAVSVL